MQPTEIQLAVKFTDGRSGWEIRRDAMVKYLALELGRVTDYTQLESLRKVLSELYSIQKLGISIPEYVILRAQLDSKQDELDIQSRKNLLLGSTQRGAK